MCGIVGTIGLADEAVIARMSAALSHRGPDDHGLNVWVSPALALGHRRLSIIDLSEAGRQPMSYGAERYWITYNGEIYNYRELRTELEGKGCEFRTETDTEVALASYTVWGTSCLDHLRGMFAFAIADFAKQDVFLARDRFGIKPLLFAEKPGKVIFASEIKSLMASRMVEKTLDPQSVWDYLSLGSVAQPRTILQGVQALGPGCAMLVGMDGRVTRRWRWWDIVSAARQRHGDVAGLSFDQAAEALRSHLDDATRCHLIADVPVGAFLSGGVDSAAMVGLMSQHLSTPIKTFTIGFEARHAALNETDWARQTARHFGTDHTEIVLSDADAVDAFDDVLAALDQPSMDGSNTFFVSRVAARTVKVALSGLGGDELFAGYPHFARHRWADRVNREHPVLSRLWRLTRILPDRFRHNLMLPALDGPERLSTLRCLMTDTEKRRALRPDALGSFAPEPLEHLYRAERPADLDAVDRLSAAELEGYMVRTLLRDGDVMSMAHSLEVRPILLDHRLAEFAFALPSGYKLRAGEAKAVFHAALRGILPDAIGQRPKRGFELPLLRWLSGVLLGRADDALSSALAKDLFSTAFLAEARRKLRRPRPRDFRLWPYVVLVEWARDCGASL